MVQPIPTLADTIALDLAKKCAEDVSAVMHRNFRLCDSKGACVQAAVAGAGAAIANVAGAIFATSGRPLDAETLDAIWRDLMRPVGVTVIGERDELAALLREQIGSKPDRING